jgi:FO synthase
MDPSLSRAIDRAARGEPLADREALALADARGDDLAVLLGAAAAARDAAFGRRLGFSPKVFLPVTNLCRNRCDYCSFRRSPGDAGEWTMTPDEVASALDGARDAGCVEALLCLGDKPENAFSAYRETLATVGHSTTVDYLVAIGRMALDRGLLPHTNAGLLGREDMARLKEVNASLGLMLESASARLCEPGMPHHKAPDKRPEKRLAMIATAGELGIAFTTGILLGIGETPRERVEALLAIRALSREFGHIQEVIVQNFRAEPTAIGVVPMAAAPEPAEADLVRSIALARLVLDPEVSVQAPPNLSPGATSALVRAGLNDFGGISPVTPDYINPSHPWPHLGALREAVRREGHALEPRLCVHERWAAGGGFVHPSLEGAVSAARARATWRALGHEVAS